MLPLVKKRISLIISHRAPQFISSWTSLIHHIPVIACCLALVCKQPQYVIRSLRHLSSLEKDDIFIISCEHGMFWAVRLLCSLSVSFGICVTDGIRNTIRGLWCMKPPDIKEYTAIVRFLLTLPLSRGVDPSDYNNQAIRYASGKGYTEIVKLLLSLPLSRGIDPSVNNNCAIRYASENGHTEIVKLLINLPLSRGVDPSAENNQSLRLASWEGHIAIVKLLLDLPVERGVDPAADDYGAIQWASEAGHTDIVKLLIDLPVSNRTYLSAFDNSMIRP